MPHPAITATPSADGYLLSRSGVMLGAVFPVHGGWVSVASMTRRWHRSKPFPTAADAAGGRFGEPGRAAFFTRRETSEVA